MTLVLYLCMRYIEQTELYWYSCSALGGARRSEQTDRRTDSSLAPAIRFPPDLDVPPPAFLSTDLFLFVKVITGIWKQIQDFFQRQI